MKQTIFIISLFCLPFLVDAQTNTSVNNTTVSAEPQLIGNQQTSSTTKTDVKFSAAPTHLYGDTIMIINNNDNFIHQKVGTQPQNTSEPK